MNEVPLQSDSAVQSDIPALKLAARQRGVVCGFADDCFAHKYLCMGVLPGSCVEMIRKAAGETCYFKIDGRTLAVRKEEAACLLLKRIAERM